MKVSIVIPAYNEEKFIGKTLEAVCALDYPDFEIIVVDNNSTDKTIEIARSFKNVHVISELQKGTQHTRERGRKAATGEIIGCIDADCLPQNNWINIGISKFENPKVVAVSGPYDYYDVDGIFRGISLLFQKYVYVFFHHLMQFFGFGAVMIAGNSLIRASALEQLGGYDTSFTFYGDDTDTAKRLAKIGTVIFYSKFIIGTSARRFQNEGVIKITMIYFLSFFKVLFFKKSKK